MCMLRQTGSEDGLLGTRVLRIYIKGEGIFENVFTLDVKKWL